MVISVTSILGVCLVLAGFALVWFFIAKLTLPEPMKAFILLILGLIGLWIIWVVLTGGGVHITR